MKAKFTDLKLKIKITNMKSTERLMLLVDTGAATSFINFKSFKLFAGFKDVDADVLLKELSKRKHYKMKVASGELIDCILYKFDLVKIDDTLIRDFKVLVPLSAKSTSTILGLDFIISCDKWTKLPNAFIMSDFNTRTYTQTLQWFNSLELSIPEFDPKCYIKNTVEDYEFDLIPKASIDNCKTKEDCDNLMLRLGLIRRYDSDVK